MTDITVQTTHTITIPPSEGAPEQNAYGRGPTVITLTDKQARELKDLLGSRLVAVAP